MAPPRRSPQSQPQPSQLPPAAPPDDAVSGSTPAAGFRPTARRRPGTGSREPRALRPTAARPADATIADGVPALPSDTIGTSRSKPKDPDPDRQTSASKVAEQSSADDSPAFSFGPAVGPGLATAAADPADSAAKPSGADTRLPRPRVLRLRPRTPGQGLGWRVFGYCAFGAPVVERPVGAGRPAVRFPGRVRVGDARPAARLAVVPGADVPAVRHVGEGPAAPTAAPPANPGKTGAGKTGRARPRQAKARSRCGTRRRRGSRSAPRGRRT